MASAATTFEGRDPDLEEAIRKAQHEARQGVPAERVGVKVVCIEFARGGFQDDPQFTVQVSRIT